MKTLKVFFIIFLFFSSLAHAGQATEGTIRQLIEITNARQLLEGVQAQINTLMSDSIQQALHGKTPTPQQQQAIAHMKDGMVGLLKSELSWDKFEPLYLRLYSESFTEEEAAGMLAFYKTPAGQAVINKMPLLMQKTMLETQKMMSGLTPGMKKIEQDFIEEMKAADKPK